MYKVEKTLSSEYEELALKLWIFQKFAVFCIISAHRFTLSTIHEQIFHVKSPYYCFSTQFRMTPILELTSG